MYEPATNEKCPSCGAQTNVSTLEPPKRDPTTDDDESLVRPEAAETEDGKPLALSGRMLAIVGGAILLGIVVIVLLVRRGHPDERAGGVEKPQPTQAAQSATPLPTASATAQPTASATAPPSATPVVTPPFGGNQGFTVPQAFDLPAAIASAAPGATVKVPAGFYSGGIVITKGVHLVGTAGQVIIQSDGRECLKVQAPDVFVQGIQFTCNGIGELPAISIADGASLELDGCRIQSATGLGLTSSGNATVSAIGTSFTAGNGTAARISGGKATFTQSTFSDSKKALSIAKAASVELKSCAFERNGSGDVFGGTVTAADQTTNVTATDCQFTGNYGGLFVTLDAAFTAMNCTFKDNGANPHTIYGFIAITRGGHATLNNSTFDGNKQGVAVSDRGRVEIDQCNFTGNGLQMRKMIIETLPLSLSGDGSTGNIRNTVFANSISLAIGMLDRATATFDHIEVAGSKTIGLGIGDTDNPPAHAEILHSKFHDNGDTGVGIFGGSTAKIEDCEFQQNQDGVAVAERNAQAEIHDARFLMNTDHGLLVYSSARVTANDCKFFHNARGAQVGLPRKSKGAASLTIDEAESGGNRSFGVGAYAQNELILRNVNFQGDDKTPIFKERNANVQVDAEATPAPEASASPEGSAEPSSTASPEANAKATATPSRSKHPRQKTHRPEDDAARILRHIFGPH
ncbi:MAG: right-handed parallel beta-helix repeat-containing protein [Chthoniobacterales bacterium]